VKKRRPGEHQPGRWWQMPKRRPISERSASELREQVAECRRMADTATTGDVAELPRRLAVYALAAPAPTTVGIDIANNMGGNALISGTQLAI
jgi:hypothetical protein